MTLLGLSIGQLGLIFLGAGSVITLLYVLKLRRRRISVPFAHLWQRVLQQRQSSSLFNRLKRLFSLLLQLAVLLLLVGALGNPRLSSTIVEGRHVVLLVDASASMQTTDTRAGTRLDEALEHARRLIRGLGGSDNLMLIQMDDQITPLTGFTADQQTLLRAVDTIDTSATAANLYRGLSYATDALRGKSKPLLILVGDGAYNSDLLKKLNAKNGSLLSDVDLRFERIGKSSDNVGIVSFSARRYPSNKLSYEVFLEVANYGNTDRDVGLQLLGDGMISDMKRLHLKANSRKRYSCTPEERTSQQQTWCDLLANGQLLEAKLVPDGDGPLDDFEADNHAYALMPKRKPSRVLLVSDGNLFLEGALLLDENIRISRVTPNQYDKKAIRDIDAVVFDSFLPPNLPDAHVLAVNPPHSKITEFRVRRQHTRAADHRTKRQPSGDAFCHPQRRQHSFVAHL